MRFARALAVLAVLAAAGCVSVPRYEGVAGAAPAAIVSFAKGHKSGYGYSGSQTYSISENGQCNDTKVAATLLWTTANQKTVKVPVGRRIVVLAATTYYFTTGVGWNGYGAVANTSTKSCDGSASFVPEAGHAYVVTQKAPYWGEACSMSVTDTTTGATPPSLAVKKDAICVGHPAG